MIAKMIMARYFRLLRSDDGATAVEAAIVLSIFLVTALGLVQFAMVYWNYSTMTLAMDEAARSAMVYNPVNYPNGPPSPPAPCPAQTQAPGCPTNAGAFENCAVAQAQTVLTNYGAPNTVKVSAKRFRAKDGFPEDSMIICSSYSFSFISPTLLPFGPIALQRQVTVPLD